MSRALDRLLSEVRRCRLCAEHLPFGPRPVVRAGSTARLLIVGQAPGSKVHATGIPWNDRSGDRLRDWLGIDRDTLDDETRVAIVSMGFCYPGTDDRGGDRPPRPECAPHWHAKLLRLMPHVGLTLLVGSIAQAYYLRARRQRTMTDTVRAWRRYGSDRIPLPDPSWRNNAWLRQNPWFTTDLLPDLRQRVADVLNGRPTDHIGAGRR